MDPKKIKGVTRVISPYKVPLKIVITESEDEAKQVLAESYGRYVPKPIAHTIEVVGKEEEVHILVCKPVEWPQLAHESFHAAMAIMRIIGEENPGEEPLAYLIEEIGGILKQALESHDGN